jgi:hypothetical protein
MLLSALAFFLFVVAPYLTIQLMVLRSSRQPHGPTIGLVACTTLLFVALGFLIAV